MCYIHLQGYFFHLLELETSFFKKKKDEMMPILISTIFSTHMASKNIKGKFLLICITNPFCFC